MDDAGKDVVHDDDQPQDTFEPNTAKTPNLEWFKQPPRPPTPDAEWNKRQVVLSQPKQPWFNQMVSATKDHPTFNDLMATPINFSKYKILGVKSVSVKKLHGYGHLEEVMVKRADQKLCKFKEGDFVDLHLNDIEVTLLLAVQHKLFHLNASDIVDFIVALRMFTRSLIIKHQVEDLQLRVESYQMKLNITPPQQTFPEIEFKELYTPSYKPLGNIRFSFGIQRRDVKEKVDGYR
nr:hypothetical protein [Tanacetum cinerariifolium]